LWLLASCSLALLALVLGIQFGFAYLATGLSPLAGVLGGEHGRDRTRAAAAGVMTWSSTRSVIGLVIALAIPKTFPERDLILVLAAVTIVGSILLQGLTLRAVVARAGLKAEGERDGEVGLAREAMEKAVAAPGPDCADGFDAARAALLKLRSHNQIGDEVLVELLRETDLTARASEGDALPGAGPPNP
jgi:CPA1 family monovalent cation:H+ antiporter